MRRFFVNDGAVFEPCLTLHGRELKALRRAGAGRETVIGEPVLDLDALRQSRVVLTNYETVTNYQHSFARMRGRWTVVVTDEAQEHKTPNTKISHALKSLDPRFRIACTGTPVETRLLDIWNIFDFLQPGRLLGSASEFSKTFETATEDDGRRDEQPAPMPSAAAIANLRTTLRFGKPDAFLLRRAKTDVLVDLPTKQEHKLKCDLSPVQRDWHIELIARASSGGPDNHPFALINRLMRVYQHPALVPAYEGIDADDAIATCPKLALLVGQLRRIEEVHEKALIFVRSLDMQQLLANVLQAELSIDAEIINGASSRTGSTVSARQTRQGILARFRQRRGFDVLILSPDVAGIGLTLVEANHVFHYGRWWNPAKEAQANDRVFRIGQTRDVHVYQLICQDPKREFTTFDEKLDALIERRRRVASDFLAPMPAEADLERELLADVCGHVGPTSASPALRVTADGLAELSWDRFEALVAALWSHRGYRTILTPKCGDEGIDVVGVDSGSIDLIQCKHTSGGMTLDTDVLAEVTRAIEGFRAKRLRHIQGQFILRGVLVTNGQLTKAARRVAVERDIRIHDREDLAKLLASHSCTLVDVEAAGVRRLATMSDVQSYLASLRAK
jgi:hypothetical protein